MVFLFNRVDDGDGVRHATGFRLISAAPIPGPFSKYSGTVTNSATGPWEGAWNDGLLFKDSARAFEDQSVRNSDFSIKAVTRTVAAVEAIP
jgi:hypothetical protein